jgi:hypothetical protein
MDPRLVEIAKRLDGLMPSLPDRLGDLLDIATGALANLIRAKQLGHIDRPYPLAQKYYERLSGLLQKMAAGTVPAEGPWFAVHPHYYLHFTPTGASWLNLVERLFAEIIRKRIRRGTFHSVTELNRAISEYLRENSRNPRRFIWTAPASSIMKKIKHCKEALDAQHQKH